MKMGQRVIVQSVPVLDPESFQSILDVDLWMQMHTIQIKDLSVYGKKQTKNEQQKSKIRLQKSLLESSYTIKNIYFD